MSAVTGTIIATSRRALCRTAAFAVISVSVLASIAAGTAQARVKTLAIYAKATRVQFVNHADDRARGAEKNPFNVDTKSLAPKSTAKEKGSGPLPGDNAFFTFRIYQDAALKHPIGSATYSCTFNFQRQAFCEASFDLASGSIAAAGPVDFNGSDITLAVSSGTGKYLGARGEVSSSAATANTHRLDFSFQ